MAGVEVLIYSDLGAKYACKEHDHSHQHDQADEPSANGRSTEIKAPAAEEEEENNDKEYGVHDGIISRPESSPHGEKF